MGKVLVVLLRWADAIALWWNSPNSARGATKAPNSPGAPRGAQGRGSRKGTSKKGIPWATQVANLRGGNLVESALLRLFQQLGIPHGSRDLRLTEPCLACYHVRFTAPMVRLFVA